METQVKVSAEKLSDWLLVANMARRTNGKNQLPEGKEITDTFKKKILLSEHSPVRMLEVCLTFEDIMQWVSVHLVRHHIGVEKFVHSQREDRRELDVPRNELPQGALNDMSMVANAQALISISRKRLCSCASKETREAWTKAKEAIKSVDPILASKMVAECVYRGFCPEMKCCGYVLTPSYAKEVAEYRDVATSPKYIYIDGEFIKIEDYGKKEVD